MDNCKYTFLLPAFKGQYLDNMLASIQNQTYKNFKVLISDDCSPEPIYEICKPYLSDPRFAYRRNNTNIGGVNLIEHWNLLVDLCDTEFLIMASDDDIYEPNFLQEIDNLQYKYPSVDLFRARVQRINEDGVITMQDYPANCYESQVDFLYGLFCLRRLKCIANYVFKSSELRKVGKFENFPYAWGSDDITIMKVSTHGVCITSKILFSFRISDKNISSGSDKLVKQHRVKARMSNLLFFDTFIKQIHSDGSLLSKQRLMDFTKFYINTWTSNIIDGACSLHRKQFVETLRFLSNRNAFSGKLDIIHFIWTWFRARKIR